MITKEEVEFISSLVDDLQNEDWLFDLMIEFSKTLPLIPWKSRKIIAHNQLAFYQKKLISFRCRYCNGLHTWIKTDFERWSQHVNVYIYTAYPRRIDARHEYCDSRVCEIADKIKLRYEDEF